MTDYNIQTIGVEVGKADIICDIDGTLMNVEDRLALAIKNKRPEDKKFTSARNERHRDVSIKQIVHGCNISMAVTRYSNKGNRLYLRRDGDFRTDDITKKEIFEKILTDGFRPQLALDDRDQVVSMWRSIGLPCFQVREGNF